MATSQKFGGNWTEEKLNIFTRYLDAYLIALQNQKFKKIYIDAFAGTGEIETSDGGQYLVGSAKRALASEKKFDHYYFIEADSKKARELQNMIHAEFPQMERIVTIYCGDANDKLAEIINRRVNWKCNRGLLFLDPYATQVNWTTLENVAKTKSIDVWYLFPFSALERMLPKNGKYDKWEVCIDRLLGDSGWRNEFYKKDPQRTLFDLFQAPGQNDGERMVKDANPDHIKEYILSRLGTIFPCVSKHARIFRNSRNSPMFLFCFAIASESLKAQRLALRMANYILKNK